MANFASSYCLLPTIKMNIFHPLGTEAILVHNENTDINLTNETPRCYLALDQSGGGIRARPVHLDTRG